MVQSSKIPRKYFIPDGAQKRWMCTRPKLEETRGVSSSRSSKINLSKTLLFNRCFIPETKLLLNDSMFNVIHHYVSLGKDTNIFSLFFSYFSNAIFLFLIFFSKIYLRTFSEEYKTLY